ncbi:MAG: hypothetical protein WCF59_12855, partial [Desulfobaccales bacterium]
MAERQNFQKTRKGRCASREFARGLKVFPPKNSRARHFFGQMYEISIIFFLVKFYGCAFPTKGEKMKSVVTILLVLSLGIAGSAWAQGGSADNGKALVETKHCALCHKEGS